MEVHQLYRRLLPSEGLTFEFQQQFVKDALAKMGEAFGRALPAMTQSPMVLRGALALERTEEMAMLNDTYPAKDPAYVWFRLSISDCADDHEYPVSMLRSAEGKVAAIEI